MKIKNSNACSTALAMFCIGNPCHMSPTCVTLLVVWRGNYRDETPCMCNHFIWKKFKYFFDFMKIFELWINFSGWKNWVGKLKYLPHYFGVILQILWPHLQQIFKKFEIWYMPLVSFAEWELSPCIYEHWPPALAKRQKHYAEHQVGGITRPFQTDFKGFQSIFEKSMQWPFLL